MMENKIYKQILPFLTYIKVKKDSDHPEPSIPRTKLKMVIFLRLMY